MLSMEIVVQKVIENSVLGGVVLVFLWFAWKGGLAFGQHFLLPIRDRIVEHIDRLDQATDSMKEWIIAQGQLIADQTKLIQNQTTLIHQQAKESDENSEKLERIDKNIEVLKERSEQFFIEAHKEHQEKHS